jgi:hypothetical protein
MRPMILNKLQRERLELTRRTHRITSSTSHNPCGTAPQLGRWNHVTHDRARDSRRVILYEDMQVGTEFVFAADKSCNVRPLFLLSPGAAAVRKWY